MFLDKLWLRIRGEILTLKEDFSSGEDLRERAADLLDRLEHHVSGRDDIHPGRDSGIASRANSGRDDAGSRRDATDPYLKDLQRELDELKAQRNQRIESVEDPEESEPLPPNPRKLG